MATGAMMVLASIIDTFVFWFVFVSENCLLDFSWISISIFRVSKSEIVCVIVYINTDDYNSMMMTLMVMIYYIYINYFYVYTIDYVYTI